MKHYNIRVFDVTT